MVKKMLSRLKRRVLAKPYLRNPALPGYWFDKYLGNQAAFILQIGSNDGKTGDPLYPLFQKHQSWKGLFVEPVPYSFQQLQQNYADQRRFTCENLAINSGETMDFYWVDTEAEAVFPDLPKWYNQLGSFDKNHILKHFDGKLAPFIRTQKIKGLALPELLTRHQINQLDILHIDTEGYDWKILSQLPLGTIRPSFILYEHHHLSAGDYTASMQFLHHEYRLYRLGIDTLAVANSIPESGLMEKSLKRITP